MQGGEARNRHQEERVVWEGRGKGSSGWPGGLDRSCAVHSFAGSPALGGAKDYFAILSLLEAPFCLGHGWLYLPLEETPRRTIPVIERSEQPLQRA